MQTLVTGGGGFIGSHLVEHLLETTDASVTVLDDFSTGTPDNLAHIETNRLTVRRDDVRNSDAVTDAVMEADEIYHLAAAVGVKKIVNQPLDSLRTNLTGTEIVLDAADNTTPVFLASSSEVYGKSQVQTLSESDDRTLGPTTTPRWGYAAAKATDEFLALAHHEHRNVPIVIGRFFNVVGPRQTGKYGMVIPRFVEQALTGDPITVYGDGNQTRSFGHVRDTVEIVLQLMRTQPAKGEVFNIGATVPTTINELAERVVELTDSDSEITHIPFEEVYGKDFEEPRHRVPDVTKLKETIGRAPGDDLDRILTDVIEAAAPGRGMTTDV